MTEQSLEPIIRLDKITKRFGGVLALDHVSFAINAGEVHAIAGENGAGKSTLMKILAGVYTQDSGDIALQGENVVIGDPNVARKLGISIVFQELNLFPLLSVSANMFINREKTKLGLLDKKGMEAESAKVLKMLDVHFAPSTPVIKLAPGEKQIVEIARALSENAHILILDEPNSALTEKETKDLFNIIHLLKQQNVTVLYISHRLEEVFQIADRITVLRDGQYVGSWKISDVSVDEIVSKMTGRRIEEIFPNRRLLPADQPIAVKVNNLSKQNKIWPINFTVRKGEVLGFAGLQGSGIEEIYHILFGLEKATTGELEFGGRDGIAGEPSEAIKKGWALIPAERRTQGLILNWPIRTNLSLVILNNLFSKVGLISRHKEDILVNAAVEEYKISTDSIDKLVSDLSGGNQQKVVIAKWMASHPQVLLMNDPTRGVDVGAKSEIYRLISKLAEEGISVLFTSSEVDEIIGLSDRILVMYKGKMVKEFNRGEADKEMIMSYVTGAAMMEEKIAA